MRPLRDIYRVRWSFFLIIWCVLFTAVCSDQRERSDQRESSDRRERSDQRESSDQRENSDQRESSSGTLILNFEHLISGQQLALNQTYTTRYGQEINFEQLRYWISNIEVQGEDESVSLSASYYLIEQIDDRDRLSIEVSIPSGIYSGLTVHIGVDPEHNTELSSQPVGELRSGIGMNWEDGSGYHFFSVSGRFTERSIDGDFAFTCGQDPLYRSISGELPTAFKIAKNERVELTLSAEIDKLFAGIELSKSAEITGGDSASKAAQVVGNYSRMFSLRRGPDDEPVSMLAGSPNLLRATDENSIPKNATPPQITHPPIDLDGMVGDHNFGQLFCGPIPARMRSDERGCMTPFLLSEEGATHAEAGFFTFVTPTGANVYATSSGVISKIKFTEHSHLTHSDLFTVVIRPYEDSAFSLEHRRIKNLQVNVDDTVEAGSVLGESGDYVTGDLGMVSFGLTRHQEVVQRVCPTGYLEGDLQQQFSDALATSANLWPDYAHEELCSDYALVCDKTRCELPSDFVPVQGDIDAGRRIYKGSCAGCHGTRGQGGIASALCAGSSCGCLDCTDHTTLAARVMEDMPPEGYCDAECAAHVSAFIMHEFTED